MYSNASAKNKTLFYFYPGRVHGKRTKKIEHPGGFFVDTLYDDQNVDYL